ncbi:MAG: type transport system permease protein [Actinomycetota bacterium]|jgi:ABC-2 type transport system permease protein|nr:type transport system permease protein [Actinomycetota bacterium]
MSLAATVEQKNAAARRAFFAILRRDVYVTWKELPAFLAQAVLQPLFLLFVFGKILTSLGYARAGYAELLFPGLMGLTVIITAVQSIAFPLVAEFGWTREIEDRLLAPMSTNLVAFEKLVFAALRALIATALMLPVGILVLGSIPWRWEATPLIIAVVLLGAFAGAGLGLIIGTLVQPQRINIVFSLIFTPLLFTGCSQYPWPSLSRLPWFQVITAFNPMTYVSEGLRSAMVPQVPHIASWICVTVLVMGDVLLAFVGLRGFRKRAIA